jgi:hypothetical protein
MEPEVAPVELEVVLVAQVVQVVQGVAQVALEFCFDVEEVGGTCVKQRPLQEAGEQQVGKVQSS